MIGMTVEPLHGVGERVVEHIEYLRRTRMVDARTPFFENVVLSEPGDVLRFLPDAAAAVLLVPMPWSVRSSAEALGAVETLLWYPLIFFALKGALRATVRRGGQRLLLVTLLMIVCGLALLEGNVGTLVRHRAVLWPLVLFFVASGLQGRPDTLEVNHG